MFQSSFIRSFESRLLGTQRWNLLAPSQLGVSLPLYWNDGFSFGAL